MKLLARRNALAMVCGLVVLLLTGCPAATLVQLDNEWTDAYLARAQAEKGEFLIDKPSNDLRLQELSTRAIQAAGKMDRSPERVGTYRVAVLAAWKAGPQGESNLALAAREGRSECGKLPNKSLSQPRDCALFELVPHLASYEKSSRAAALLRRQIASAGTQAEKDAGIARIRTSVMEMSTAFEDVQKTRVAYEKPEVPDAFHGYVKEQMRNMYCDFTTVVGDTNLSLLSDSAVTQKVKQMGNTLRSMTVSTGC